MCIVVLQEERLFGLPPALITVFPWSIIVSIPNGFGIILFHQCADKRENQRCVRAVSLTKRRNLKALELLNAAKDLKHTETESSD
jgi:hypothetical protein